jgi:hypothetical protein
MFEILNAKIRFALMIVVTFLLLVNFSLADDGVEVLESSSSHMIIGITPQFSGFEEIAPNGQTTYVPVIEGAYPDVKDGSFSMVISLPIAVPGPKGFRIEKEITDESDVKGNTPPPPSMIDGAPRDMIISDFGGYQAARLIHKMEYAGISGNIHIANLKVRVAGYDPASGRFDIADSIKLHISFDNKYHETNKYAGRITAPVLNPRQARHWTIGTGDKLQKAEPGNLTSLSDGVWLKIEIEEEGIYKIDAGMLSSLGVSISPDKISTIKIFGKGGRELSEKVSQGIENRMNEQPLIVNTKNDGSLDNILFYGASTRGFEYEGKTFQRYINHYSDKNYYLLTWGGSEGVRAEAAIYDGEVENPAPSSYIHRMFYEEELTNAFNYGSGRTWFGRSLFTAPFVNKLHNLDRSGTVEYKFYVAHRSELSGYFKYYENGNKLTETHLSGVNLGNYRDAYRATDRAEIPATDIAGDSRSILTMEYTAAAHSAIGYLDYYEIHYPRYFKPIKNEIAFFSNPEKSGLSEFTINEFSGGEIIGFDVTDRDSPILLNNRSIVGGMFTFRADIEENSPQRFYISSKFKKPQLKNAELVNLRGEHANTDVIVITHPDLLQSAEMFKNYREANSDLSISIAQTHHIYNEFAGGMPDVSAIRDFIAYAVHNWSNPPRYIVLWGDGHYDYKNITSGATNYIPPYETLNEDLGVYAAITSYTIEDYFARVVGDDRNVDLCHGRMPVTSNEMGEWLVEKIEHYEQNSSLDAWRTNVTLVADDGPTDNGDTDHQSHTVDSEKLSKYVIDKDLVQNKIYIVQYPTENVPGGRRKPRASEDLVSSVNTKGSLIVSWIGHGNPRVWAHEEVFDRGITIPQMTNLDKLFFLTAATCDFGRFDHPDVQCGSEDLVTSKAGGAIGVFSSSRLVLAISNYYITRSFYEYLFQRDSTTGRYCRLGDVMHKVKIKNNGAENDEKFYLLADPTMRILLPENIISIDSINNQAIADREEPLELKGLSEISIAGRVLDYSTGIKAADFNGTTLLTMLDGDETVEVTDVYGDVFNYFTFGSALNRTSAKVENGDFTTNFIIPKDISFSEKEGRLFAYAFTENDRFGKGSCRNFVVNGVNTTSISDRKGPEISVFMDSREFHSGDVVREDPLLIVDLFDHSGINSTGRGIGHKIEAWIDDNPTPIDLTDKFSISLYDPRNGTVEDMLFDIEAGLHKIKVRAWDVYNNYSTAETYFRVAPDNNLQISELYCYPNPFEKRTTVRFKHNIQPPVEVDLYIYNYMGERVRKIEMNNNDALVSEIEWDGRDEDGTALQSGAYLLRVRAQSLSGGGVTESTSMSVTVK